MTQADNVADLRRDLASIKEQLWVSRRNSRRWIGTTLLAGFALLAVAQVKVEDADFEIHPNASGGNPNDSYMLKLVGDGNSGADRAMTLRTIPTTDSDYRLAIGDNSGTERVTVDNDGNVGIGDTTPNYVLDVNGDARTGWNGNSTRIKILPHQFIPNDDENNSVAYEDDDTNKAVRVTESDMEMYAFVAIPEGYKATHARIYGGATDTVTVYESDIDDGQWGSSLGSASVGTEINITDVNADTTNFLVIKINVNSSGDDIYGGYVTIARQ